MGQVVGPRPRILHLLSEWQWIGPAEPTVNLCRALRRHGHVVDLACAKPPGEYPQSLEHRARERRVEPITDFNLQAGGFPFRAWADIAALTEFIDREEIQIVHVHTRHDHYIGSRAARKANNQPFIVRTNHTGAPLAATLANRWTVRGHTDAWVAPTDACRAADVENFGLNAAHAITVEGAVDLERFNADQPHADVRAPLGLTAQHVVAGVVAQTPPEGFETFRSALARAAAEEPALRALVIGDAPAGEPAAKDLIVFAGRRDDDYVDCLAAVDFLVFLVPGADGCCRTVGEAMALGKPALVSARGLLPHLVEDGRCGLVAEETPEALSQALLKLARNRGLRERLGRNAALRAREQFNVERQVEAIANLYLRLAEGV